MHSIWHSSLLETCCMGTPWEDKSGVMYVLYSLAGRFCSIGAFWLYYFCRPGTENPQEIQLFSHWVKSRNSKAIRMQSSCPHSDVQDHLKFPRMSKTSHSADWCDREPRGKHISLGVGAEGWLGWPTAAVTALSTPVWAGESSPVHFCCQGGNVNPGVLAKHDNYFLNNAFIVVYMESICLEI